MGEYVLNGDQSGEYFLHGSTHWFAPGDTVEPRNPGLDSQTGENRAYAVATRRGLTEDEPGPSGKFHRLSEPHARYAAAHYAHSYGAHGQMSLFHPIHEVEPLSPATGDPDERYNIKGGYASDPKGLRVKGVVGYSRGFDDGDQPEGREL